MYSVTKTKKQDKTKQVECKLPRQELVRVESD